MIRTAIILSAILAAAMPAPPASAARSVALVDARTAPSYVAMLPADARMRVPACHGNARPSDTSAYAGTGRAIGAQHRTPSGAHVWATSTGYVARYGRTFVNRSRSPVLIAIWCEDRS